MSRYTHAVVCRIPFNVQMDAPTSQHAHVELVRARKEQEEFCDTLREAGVDVIELAPEENAPASSLFVEDGAIVCNGTALITRPSHPVRRKDMAALFMELGLHVLELDGEAYKQVMLDGSDVLFTGREFFVGISKRTNVAGAMEVAKTFPEFPVTPVKIAGPHHLKYYVCLAGPSVLAVGSSKESQNILKRIEREATFRYQVLTLPSDDGVNCLNINGTLLFRPEISGAAEKFQSLQETRLCPVDMLELSKMGGLLSQHVVLFRRIKLLKKL